MPNESPSPKNNDPKPCPCILKVIELTTPGGFPKCRLYGITRSGKRRQLIWTGIRADDIDFVRREWLRYLDRQ